MEKKFKELTLYYRNSIEKHLDTCLIYPDEPQALLFSAMRYSLLAGGKRLRPLLVLEFCRLCGGSTENAYPLATAVEMVHTYSLIHDDLPCMDNDDFRRGKPTNHKVYGESIAVLAGDGLLTSAFSQIATANLPADARIEAVRILSECAGELGMVGGQVLDMESENRECTASEVINIQSRKTGALIRCACLLGVIAGAGNKLQMEKATVFANNLGLAFQIRDDILDEIGNADILGKAVKTDISKNTFVQLYGIDKCKELVEKHTKLATDALNIFDDPAYLKWLAESLMNREV